MVRRACLVLSLLCSCSKEGYTRSSAKVSAPAGAPWSDARASVVFEAAVSGPHSSLSEHVRLRLQLGGGNPRTLELDDYYRGDAPGDTSAAEYKQALEPSFDLQFAPDGQALALSLDGGTSYRRVVFDAGEPLYCAHETFAAGELWSAVPATRALVLDILASADPPSGEGTRHLVPGEYPRARERFLREFRVAREFACAHTDDDELRRAAVDAVVRPGDQLNTTADYMPLVQCVGDFARAHPELRAPLLAALADAKHEHRHRAALSLTYSASPDVQAALVRAAASLPSSCDEGTTDCAEARLLRRSVAWAFAAVSTGMGALPDDARDLAITLSKDADAVHRVLGTRALAVGTDEVARARLTELAAEPCGKALPAWTDSFDDFWAVVYDPGEASCWARAALARAP